MDLEIIGLSFEQFCKTVVLSQGKFAELIQAPKKVRYALLEEITGNSYFRKIGTKIYDAYDKVDKEVSDKNKVLETHQSLLIEDDVFEENQQELNSSKEKLLEPKI